MDAGSMSFLMAFAYDSDDNVPIAAADPKYLPGLPIGKVEWKIPFKQIAGKPYWLATSANPAGWIPKKIPLHNNPFSMKLAPIDGICDYVALGEVALDTPDTDIMTITGSVSGDVPQCIWHKETNQAENEQAKEYLAKVIKMATSVKDGLLIKELTWLPSREYNMTVDSVVQSTYEPTMRKTTDGTAGIAVSTAVTTPGPYKITGNANISATWNSKSFGAYLLGYSWSVENMVKGYLLRNDTNYGALVNHGTRKYSDVVLELIQPPGATNDLDDMEQYIDNSTTSNLVIKIPRNHANDYHQETFLSAYLKSWTSQPNDDSEDTTPTIIAEFTGFTGASIVDRQVTAAGAADPCSDADYEE